MDASEYKNLVAIISTKDPILGIIAKRVKVVLRDDIPTAMTDGKTVSLNPRFMDSLRPSERAAILAHELLHILHMHAMRLKKYDHLIANIAADAKVNCALDQGGFVLPEGAITCKTIQDVFGISKSWCENASAEELAEALSKMIDKATGLDVNADIVFSDGSDTDVGGGGNDGKGDGKVINDGDINESTSDDELRSKVVQVLMAAKVAGVGKGDYDRLIDELTKSKADWRRVLKAWLMRYGNKVRLTWTRENRKLDDVPGKERFGKGKLVVIVDVSGSVSEDELRQFISEVYAIASLRHSLTLITFDDGVRDVIDIKRPDDIKRLRLKGGGGTRIKEALELVKRKYNKADAIIILSDWEIYDLRESIELLKSLKNKVIAVTTYRAPPPFLKSIKLTT